MTLQELKPLLIQGKTGLIPKWKGYLYYDRSLHQIYFENGDYKLYENELEGKISNRTDLYYII